MEESYSEDPELSRLIGPWRIGGKGLDEIDMQTYRHMNAHDGEACFSTRNIGNMPFFLTVHIYPLFEIQF
jgi:hypothetical protein